MQSWHTQDAAAVVEQLGSRMEGLTQQEVQERLARFGPNQLEERRLRSPWAVLAGQFTEIMVLVLAVAAAISFAIGETTDGIMILIIVVLNALLGFTQEYRAERAMATLKSLAISSVKVRRGGQVHEVGTSQLVPGDIILVEAGLRIPADARVLEAANLRVEEAALTGESVPVDKTSVVVSGEDLPLGDRRNMLYMGTTAVYG
ncbi:MAG: HAD-IC family P-type ATPase, partial [Chloroflexi bacterium]|nr:HAD-IC family P-type ATPase [Chloroflexota bacterium]